MVYELRMALPELGPVFPALNKPASFNEIELFHYHLERVAIRSGFLDPREPKRFTQRMRRLFARARLEKEEVNVLRGVLSALEKWM
jgi:tRNA/rRNA methyltransferase